MSYNPLPIFCTIKPSFINGLGLFATREIRKDTELGISHIEVDNTLYRTALGGFINHSDTPNCLKEENIFTYNLFLKTTKDIKEGEELTLNYTLYRMK